MVTATLVLLAVLSSGGRRDVDVPNPTSMPGDVPVSNGNGAPPITGKSRRKRHAHLSTSPTSNATAVRTGCPGTANKKEPYETKAGGSPYGFG